ncbi:MAG: modification enzyme MiaB family [Peptococcaceae bacterium]|nr:modification enzyme MiaB family [Peptococcaceae bacterium]
MKGRVAFYTLGCKVNQNETEALTGMFKSRGYEVVDFEDPADVYVINTCTVTHLGDRKSRQMIRKAVKANPQAKIVVTGCYAQTSPGEVTQIPGVNLVVGTSERGRIVDLVEELGDRKSPLTLVKDIKEQKVFEDIPLEKIIERARAYLKVQEGCEQFCSYCIIPYARGPVRSRSIGNTIQEAQKLINAGFKEIILTGIHLGAYGKDLGEGVELADLLAELLPLAPEVRWRLSSIEPTEVTARILKLLVEYKNFCPHLHLPLQSAHDEILKAMNRPYTTKEYRDIVTKIRTKVPGISITTDIMVGFPGEREEQFNQGYEFVREMAFSDIHVFKYSPRRGTPAAEFPGQVPPPVKEERSRKLILLAEELAENYSRKFLGNTLDVLVETYLSHGYWEGHTPNYLKVQFPSCGVSRGQIVPVKIKEVQGKKCLGEINPSVS